ncbi:MAG: YwqG family protein [Pseudobacter sp.]|uniref:YwqG family protein n=1 Tax=Pseudobacter sp. TaxID=2045420 RepID=UPI003F806A1E
MGIFDFFSKKKKDDQSATQFPQQPAAKQEKWDQQATKPSQHDADYLLEKIEVIPGLVLPRAFADHWPELSQTKRTFIKINAIPSDDIGLEQSKFAFYPMLPVGFPYPTAKDGNFMFPLAQINFREMPPLQGYPKTGYLQFYIATDDTHGLRFDNEPSDFKVLFFEEHEVEQYQTDFSFLSPVLSDEMQPVYKPHVLSFEIQEEYFGVANAASEKTSVISLNEIAAKYDGDLEDELMEFAYDNFSHNGHKVGGYAYFTQEDPRMYNEELKNHVLLLQIDSDIEIMWGDSGVCNFFIHPDDLAKKDFSNVYYNWDCS